MSSPIFYLLEDREKRKKEALLFLSSDEAQFLNDKLNLINTKNKKDIIELIEEAKVDSIVMLHDSCKLVIDNKKDIMEKANKNPHIYIVFFSGGISNHITSKKIATVNSTSFYKNLYFFIKNSGTESYLYKLLFGKEYAKNFHKQISKKIIATVINFNKTTDIKILKRKITNLFTNQVFYTKYINEIYILIDSISSFDKKSIYDFIEKLKRPEELKDTEESEKVKNTEETKQTIS